MHAKHLIALAVVLLPGLVCADLRDLVAEDVLAQIAAETSGEAAKRNLDTITLQHRMRASSQFDAATDHIVRMLEAYGLDEVEVLAYPADGETLYGTQKARPVWNVSAAELWEVRNSGGSDTRLRRLADWQSVPLSLAQDSLSGEVTTTLVDIGAGTAAADYRAKDIRGKLVLTESQPEAVAARAVGELGAAGIISYAPNQRSAWWKEDDRLVRWGHLDSFPEHPTFGFMISLADARELQARLKAGEEIRLQARVDARHETGSYRFATAAIRGVGKAAEQIHLTCHLDHPRPGANDNASGCVGILETARTLNALIDAGILPRPARTIRFLWPAEIEGSIIYLSQHEDAASIKANIHMDMVGGGPVTKAVFRISGGPISVPSFISDVGHEVGRFVNAETLAFANGDATDFALNAPEGGKEPLMSLMEGLDMGSDHDVFFEGSWRIPGLYLHDWPDRYIHTNFDLAANIDPTKLKRAAFIGAVSAWFLATMDDEKVPAVLALLERSALARSADLVERRRIMGAPDQVAATDVHFAVERRKVHSIESFAPLSEQQHAEAMEFLAELQALVAVAQSANTGGAAQNETIYERNPDILGPMSAFGYSFLEDRYDGNVADLRIRSYSGAFGSGGQYAYEALNLVDGSRTVSDIRDWLTTELGPIPLDIVEEYLGALESIDVIRTKQD